ncbi:GeoRSP system SPASM domain protein [Geobacter sp. AOG1]|uniref:GeoRSP system SPASM domain protein n=1 Tax=Geobacter sp. AOG1 TaxID=1566346 RepID=UPI001CC7366C|nr:GeoRSP system SPASM domain protein [Geobacter sp. AOG1]GFE56422.1 GeoRSP system SPASM domain protein [Geobacter sp. AOG1]
MELATPITIYWDLAPDAPRSDYLLRIAADIAACRPLMLQLYDPSPRPGEALHAVLEQFRGMPVAVSLTMTPDSFSHLGGSAVGELGVKEVLLAIDTPDVLGNLAGRVSLGVSWSVTRDNWRLLPGTVATCRARGFHRLVLPMQRLYNGEAPFLLSRDEQGELERELAASGGTEGINLTIHDPFLWRSFNPGVPFPQGGCQAANTMIAISPDGGVYPCPSLPVRLGKIGARSLKEIIASSEKREFRRRLLLDPEGCRDCRELAECRGGCRGRAYVMHGTLDGIDEACR